MSVPRKNYLYSLERAGKFLSYNVNAVIGSAQYKPLANNPSGWKDISIAFGTSNKYFNLARSFSVPLKFIGDGADILRYYQYNGKGYEEDISVRILKWNAEFIDMDGKEGRYELEYLGKIDFTKMKDDPLEGFQVNTIEGGVLSYLNANDGVTYELQCNPDHPDAFPVLFDGVDLFDKYNYSILNINTTGLLYFAMFVPVVFINNEGDSVGIVKANSDLEDANNVDYATSANYIFQSYTATTITVAGKISFKIIANTQIITVSFRTSKGTEIEIIPITTYAEGQTVDVDFSKQINLDVQEKLFITLIGSTGANVEFIESHFSISFTSRNTTSTAYFRHPLSVLKELVEKMSGGKFTADSAFLKVHNNLCICGGQSLREQKDKSGKLNGVIKTTFQDFFTDYDADYNLAVKVVNEVLYLEPKADIYNENSQVFDVGEISELSVNIATEYLANTVKVGSPAQTYDERNGKYEFAGTDEFKLPVNSIKKELNLVGKYRRDPYGIEFYRGKLNNKDTTDNKGDNEVFKVNVARKSLKKRTFQIFVDTRQQFIYSIVITNNIPNYDYFAIGNKITFSGTQYNDREYTVIDRGPIVDNAMFTVWLDETVPVTPEISSFTITVDAYVPKRVVYDTPPLGLITPNIDGPGAIFNIEEMTPKRQLLAHANYLASPLAQLGSEKITFQTADRNKDLSTTLNGVTTSESADIVVSKLGKPLFLPYEIDFTTKVPYAFAKLMNRISGRYIKGTYNNFPLYFLPIGDMKSKPATNEAQEWKLLAAPMTSLDTLQKLSEGTFIINNSMTNQLFISDYNPVHFVQYDYHNPAKYHYKGIYQDRFELRQDRYDSKDVYYQKWQKSDIIPIQFIVVGYGQIEIHVYDGQMAFIEAIPATVMVDTSVQSPYVKQQADIDLTNYVPGCYQFVVVAEGVKLGISEWQQVNTDLPETLLIEYYHTKNKPYAYFKEWRPNIRIEGLFLIPSQESSSNVYEDDGGDTEIMHGEAYTKEKVILGDGYGIPDYLARKLNKIFLLNQVFIEGTEYTKDGGGKLETVELVEGYPMNYYTVELRASYQQEGLLVSDNNISPSNPGAESFTIDAEGIGQGTGTITIEID